MILKKCPTLFNPKGVETFNQLNILNIYRFEIKSEAEIGQNGDVLKRPLSSKPLDSDGCHQHSQF